MKTGNRKTKETLTPRDVARDCGFGVTNTYKMLADGTIPSIRVGNRFFIPRAALQSWLASCGKPDATKGDGGTK
jgi:excisionase family DNA binding protein